MALSELFTVFSVAIIDWGDNIKTVDFGLDIAAAVKFAEKESVFGNTDYTILFNNGLPTFKYQDGEKVPA